MSAPEHVHTRPAGYSGAFGIPEPPAGTDCDYCGKRPGLPHQCLADGANHGHGMTHVPITTASGDLRRGDLAWLCCSCVDAIRNRLDPPVGAALAEPDTEPT